MLIFFGVADPLRLEFVWFLVERVMRIIFLNSAKRVEGLPK